MKKIVPVVAGVIVKGNGLKEVLLHKRSDPDRPDVDGRWEFPGGRIQYGETPEQALCREIREECNGVIVKVNNLLHVQSNIYSDGVQYIVMFYQCQTSYGTSPDGFEYFRLNNIYKLDCLPGTHGALRNIR